MGTLLIGRRFRLVETVQPATSFLEKVYLKKTAKSPTCFILVKTAVAGETVEERILREVEDEARQRLFEEEQEEEPGPRGTKRKRPERSFRKRKARAFQETAEEEEGDIVLADIAGPSGVATPKRKRRRARKGKRKPTLKSKLLKRLRAKKRIQKAKLRQTERDINSLVCRRKKAE